MVHMIVYFFTMQLVRGEGNIGNQADRKASDDITHTPERQTNHILCYFSDAPSTIGSILY